MNINKNMNVIIPIGGKGQRFKDEGYSKPKPLVDVLDKPILKYVLDNLKIKTGDHVYIIYNTMLEEHNFTQIISSKYPFVKFIALSKNTNGASETLYLGLKSEINNMNLFNKNIILDCDTFYKEDILNLYRESLNNNIVFYSSKQDEKPIYSYIQMNDEMKIIDIQEKTKISNNANTGAYCFESIDNLLYYCKHVIDNNITFNNETYTTCVINEMITNGEQFYGYELSDDCIVSLGTPNDVHKYSNETKILLFDLDGTLVNTDFIYIKVWNKLLKKYNIECDKNFFDFFIKGKNDVDFLQFMNSRMTKDDIVEISKEKDHLFISYLQTEKYKILLDGAVDFIENNKHHKIAIVTSCNKKAVNFILEKNNLLKYVDLVIASEDCMQHKPSPQPYLKAISHFKCNINNVFVFEDSYSGYSSAMRATVKNICLIQNEDSCSEIHRSTHFKYTTYNKLKLTDIENFYNNNIHNNYISDYINDITATLNTFPIKKISKLTDTLKKGYICDINNYRIDYINDDTRDIILKISNFDNELSKTAIKLNMYQNETYFYDKISHLIHNVPKYLGSFKDNDKDAIILEDLKMYPGSFNLNLNKNVNLLLNVVKSIFDIHKTFRFETSNDLLPNMKELKKMNEISYYKELIYSRFELFENNVQYILNNNEKKIIKDIYKNIDKLFDDASTYPLNFCHGDFKSPNIFFKNNCEPILLDWQYIHLNKGVSDIVFLLVESIEFDLLTVEIVINFYYKLQKESCNITYDEYLKDFKTALCIFPFFVCVWFNSEPVDKILDKVFPIRFLKNLMKYYKHYL